MISSPTALEGRRRHSLQFHPGAGYWIAPDGAAFPVTTHIAAICDAPEVFGLDPTYLREAFARYGEPWASEGNARREIILAVINGSGWIRIRHYRRSGWTVNVPTLDIAVRNRVQGFFRELFRNQLEFDTVRLDHPAGVLTTSIDVLLRQTDSLAVSPKPRQCATKQDLFLPISSEPRLIDNASPACPKGCAIETEA